MSEIVRMLRFGRSYTITLDCGHEIERTLDEAKLQQLYVDKRIGCVTCEQIEHGYDTQPGASADKRVSVSRALKKRYS